MLAVAALKLGAGGKMKSIGRHHPVDEGRAAFKPVPHQAAVELDQQIVRKPVIDIMPLQRRQRAVTVEQAAGKSRHARGGDAVAFLEIGRHGAGEQPGPQAGTGPRRKARAKRAQSGAVAAVSGEELVASLSRKNDLDVARRAPCQMGCRQDRIIGHRVVAGQRRQPGVGKKVVAAIGDIDEFGAFIRGKRRGKGGLVIGLGVETHGIAQDRVRMPVTCAKVGKRGKNRRGIDAAGKEQPERHVGHQMRLDTVVKTGRKLRRGAGVIPVVERPVAGCTGDPAVANDQRLAWRDAADPGKGRKVVRGILPVDDTGGMDRVGLAGVADCRAEGGNLRREEDAIRGFGDVERLDPERVADQDAFTAVRVPQRGGIHAAKLSKYSRAVPRPQCQNGLAVGVRGETVSGAVRCTKRRVVVDLAIRRQHLSAVLRRRHEGLRPVGKIDNRQPRMDDAGMRVGVTSAAVGTAMRQRRFHPVERTRRHVGAGPHEIAADAAHQPATFSRKPIQSAVTRCGDRCRCQCARPAAASRFASAASLMTVFMASARASTSSTGTRTPFTPSSISSRPPLLAVEITGLAQARPSAITLPKGSCRDGHTSRSAPRMTACGSSCQPMKWTRSAICSSPARAASASRSGPSPASHRLPCGSVASARIRLSKALFGCSLPSAAMTGPSSPDPLPDGPP